MDKDLKQIFKSSGMDDRSATFLISALEKHNLKGFDYIEFKQSLAKLLPNSPDETQTYQMVFTTASTMGLTRKKLIESAQYYRKVLEKEKIQFDDAFQKQTQSKIDGKLKEVEKLKKAIDQKNQQIKKMQDEINQHQTVIDNSQEEIDQAKSKINSTKMNFENTFESLTALIDDDVQKISQYIIE